MMIRRLARCALGLALACGIGAPALAQEPSAIAEGLFQQGRELMKQGKLDEACPKLAESQRLDPKLGTLLNLAVCHEQQGRTASAWAEYTAAAAIARRDGQREREDFARKQAVALDKRLARVTLQVSSPEPGIVVKLDDQGMTAAAYGVPLPVDPGQHRVSVSAPGKATWTKTVDVPAQGTEVLVAVPPLAPEPSAPPTTATPVPVPVVVPPAPTAPVASPPVVEPKPREAPSNTPTVLMALGFGVGGLSLVIGAVAGGVSISDTNTIKASCTPSNLCPGQSGAISSANTVANVSNAFLGLGVVGLAVGVTGVILRPKSTSSGSDASIQPFVGPVSGVRVSF